MASSNQERQRQQEQQQQHQQAQQQQQQQQEPISWPQPECCGHFADAYGNFSVPYSCSNEDCTMRGIQSGSPFICPDCNNTKLVWEYCGCPPAVTVEDQNYGLANEEQTAGATSNAGKSGEASGRRRRVARRGGERRSVDRQ
ncbi:hypothetical protein MCOR25_003092 [Pyricularia grisea]|nr:hypothetical protein MCOR25_003092 [Pyricularia grisea]